MLIVLGMFLGGVCLWVGSEFESAKAPENLTLGPHPTFVPEVLVKGLDGAPLAGAQAVLQKFEVDWQTGTIQITGDPGDRIYESDERGVFRFTGLPPGPFWAVIRQGNAIAAVESFMPNAESDVYGLHQKYTDGRRPFVEVKDSMRLTIDVLDLAGQPVEGAIVVLTGCDDYLDSEEVEFGDEYTLCDDRTKLYFNRNQLSSFVADDAGRVELFLRDGYESGLFAQTNILTTVLRYGADHPFRILKSEGHDFHCEIRVPQIVKAEFLVLDSRGVPIESPFELVWNSGVLRPKFKEYDYDHWEYESAIDVLRYRSVCWPIWETRKRGGIRAFAPGAVLTCGLRISGRATAYATHRLTAQNHQVLRLQAGLGSTQVRFCLQGLGTADLGLDAFSVGLEAADGFRENLVIRVSEGSDFLTCDVDPSFCGQLHVKMLISEDTPVACGVTQDRLTLARFDIANLKSGEIQDFGAIRVPGVYRRTQ